VPISELIAYVDHARTLVKASNLNAPLVGHIGYSFILLFFNRFLSSNLKDIHYNRDGNLHFFIVFVEQQRTIAHQLNVELVELALKCGGTCTGEHGIGVGK
jgi:D-lactate dehydrogenase (cytochrome)